MRLFELKSRLPNFLYYNCSNPTPILESCVIKASDIHAGVSMSTNHDMISHGPFKFTFKKSSWFNQFIKVQYWDLHSGRSILNDPENRRDAYAETQEGNRISMAQYEELRDQTMKQYPPEIFHRIWKNSFMFADEKEWYSPNAVNFNLDDVEQIEFMSNAPNLHPRKANQARKFLMKTFSEKYKEISIFDPKYHS